MTDQAAPKPIFTRAAEATAAGAANVWTFLTSLSPAINNAVSALAIPLLCVALGIGSIVGYQKATAPIAIPVALPDPPKAAPVPVVSTGDVDHIVAQHCAGISGKLDTLLDRTAPKGSARKTSGRK